MHGELALPRRLKLLETPDMHDNDNINFHLNFNCNFNLTSSQQGELHAVAAAEAAGGGVASGSF
jgi:hypothetical protein